MEMFVKFKHFMTLSILAFFTLLSLFMYCHWNDVGKFAPKPSSIAVQPMIIKAPKEGDALPLKITAEDLKKRGSRNSNGNIVEGAIAVPHAIKVNKPEVNGNSVNDKRNVRNSSPIRGDIQEIEPEASITHAVLSVATKESSVGGSSVPLPRSIVRLNKSKSTIIDTKLLELRKLIDEINAKQEILNEDKFGPLKDTDYIFLIQVHNRTDYFKLLIDSLRNVDGINETLLIFSHDIFSDLNNQIVHSVDFAKVMQIFYPNSSQLYPNTFPGDDPNDCPRDIKQEDAIRMQCNNALHPDSFDHYRESQYAQIKHHWFWKVNFVFDSLRVTRNYSGFVTIIEDDYYMLPDSIYVLNAMKREAFKRDNIGLLSLGTRDFNYDFIRQLGVIEVQEDVHFHSITMNKQLWRRLKSCASRFCYRDEYHWDWSFYHIVTQCLQPAPLTLEMASSRVYHIGDCGMHRTRENCFDTYERVTALLNNSSHNLFPKKFDVIEGNSFIRTDNVGPWGGFSDPRDLSLCMSFVRN